jgi:hypothetical protein
MDLTPDQSLLESLAPFLGAAGMEINQTPGIATIRFQPRATREDRPFQQSGRKEKWPGKPPGHS